VYQLVVTLRDQGFRYLRMHDGGSSCRWMDVSAEC
jgi:hypothetical protein